MKGDKEIIPEFAIFLESNFKIFLLLCKLCSQSKCLYIFAKFTVYCTTNTNKCNVVYILTAPGTAVNTNWLSLRKSVIVSVYYVIKASPARVHARNSGTGCRRGSLGLGRGIWTTYPTCVYIVGWVRRLLGWLLASRERRSGQTRGHWNQLYGPDILSWKLGSHEDCWFSLSAT